MKKYRIFFLGYGGKVFDAARAEIIPDVSYETQDKAFSALIEWGWGESRKDLTFVVLPVYEAK